MWPTCADLRSLIVSAFGTVWKIVTRNEPPIELAVKHIGTGLVSSFSFSLLGIDENTDTKDIENEIEILKKCKSEYIVSYFGIYRTDILLWVLPTPFISHFEIIMDFCELGSVLDLMEKRNYTFQENEALWILKSSLLGLQYLHKMDVIHRYVVIIAPLAHCQ